MERKKLYRPQIENIIAVASGKGGVGKSTVACNLAVGLGERGFKVGILDADIYGPSIPLLMGQKTKMELNEGRFSPLEAYGVHTVSMGFLIEENQALMWRGPMLQTAIKQFLTDVSWPPLDFLIIDMPPGTGDAHLTVAQSMALMGVILVSTPQQISLIDAVRCLKTFQTLKVPILGMIENMAGLDCPHCHRTIDVFKKDTIESFCVKEQIPYLGSIPFTPAVMIESDRGVPIIINKSNSAALAYEEILSKTWG